MRKLSFIFVVLFIAQLSYTQSVKKQKTLGEKPGLGSDCFIEVDTVFHFSTNLNVQGKIYYKEYAKRYKEKQEGEEKRFLVKNINLAYDTLILSCSKADTLSLGGISAIKISQNNLWHTMYSETEIFVNSTEIKELGGTGKKDGFFYLYVCPTEQPYFSLRVKMSKKKQLIKEFKNFFDLWNKVGTGIVN